MKHPFAHYFYLRWSDIRRGAILCTVIVLWCSGGVRLWGQSLSRQLSNPQVDDSLTIDLVQTIINREFSSVVSGQSTNTLGNFAALDLSDTKVDFNGNVFFNNRSVLSIKAAGGVSGGLLEVFSNTELNRNVALNLNYHILLPDFVSYINRDEKFSYKLKEDSLEKAYRIDSIRIANQEDLLPIHAEGRRLARLLQLKRDTLAQLLKSKRNTLNDFLIVKRDSQRLVIDTLVLHQEILFLADDQTIHSNVSIRRYKMRQLQAAHLRRQHKLRRAFELFGYQLKWLSLGYRIRNESFHLFDARRAFDQQISKDNSTLHEFSVQHSTYHYHPGAGRTYYFAFGLGFALSDNLATLSKSDFTETRNYGPMPGDRLTTLKYSAYNASEYKDFQYTLRMYSDLYWFMNAGNSLALHVFPEFNVVKDARPSLNSGLGFLMGFRDKKEASNIVNAEIYINLRDLGNSNDFEESLFKRSSYGLRFTFPIKFKTVL